MIFPRQIFYAILILESFRTALAQTLNNATQTDSVLNNDVVPTSNTGQLSTSRMASSLAAAVTSSVESQTIPLSTLSVLSSLSSVPSTSTLTQLTAMRSAGVSSTNAPAYTSASTIPHSSSGSSTFIDVSLLTTFVIVGSTTSPTTISRTVVKIGTVTGSSVAEVTAALNAASQENTGSGLSSQNKKIIIGVVAGVAGLVVLAALSTLLFRFIGKRSMSDEYTKPRNDPFVADTYDPYGSHHHQQLNSKSRTRIDEISKNF